MMETFLFVKLGEEVVC